MVWQMKLSKYIIASLILYAMYSYTAYATCFYNKCNNKYSIKNSINICSERKLSDVEEVSVKQKYNKALSLFPSFIKKYGYKWDGANIDLIIYIIPYNTLNDKKLFSNPPGQMLLGRYTDWTGKLYISYGAMLGSNTDFVHELAHYFNNNIPVTDDEENEKIAQQFEQYYLDNS